MCDDAPLTRWAGFAERRVFRIRWRRLPSSRRRTRVVTKSSRSRMRVRKSAVTVLRTAGMQSVNLLRKAANLLHLHRRVYLRRG